MRKFTCTCDTEIDDIGYVKRVIKEVVETASIKKEVEVLVDVAKELRDLMEDVRTGNYKPDTFTNQPFNTALTRADKLIKELSDEKS